jgi:hypothetical protein
MTKKCPLVPRVRKSAGLVSRVRKFVGANGPAATCAAAPRTSARRASERTDTRERDIPASMGRA